MLIGGIVAIIFGILFATGYFYSAPSVRLAALIGGIGLILIGLIIIVIYVMKPEQAREKLIEKWKKKQAKKG